MKCIAIEFANNMFGKLRPSFKKRLYALIENPCPETWDDTHCIVLKGQVTLWQAVLAVQPSYQKGAEITDPIKKWFDIPSKEIIIRAITTAVFKKESQTELN